VSQSKFVVLMIMPRKIFGEFMRFFPKGLNPFKIQTKFNLVCFLGFLFIIYLEFEHFTNRKVVPFEIIFYPAKYDF
jgi:hypothetical protein